MKNNPNKAFNTILADAVSKTSVLSGRIDMDELMAKLCGKYIINGKEVVKNDSIPEESSTDRR